MKKKKGINSSHAHWEMGNEAIRGTFGELREWWKKERE